jgi:hypothetical protein
VRRAGPEVVEKLNAALLHKLAAGKLPQAAVDTTVVEADIGTRPMRICWSMRSASWVAGPAAAGEAPIGA